jgi:hypothetical protein
VVGYLQSLMRYHQLAIGMDDLPSRLIWTRDVGWT